MANSRAASQEEGEEAGGRIRAESPASILAASHGGRYACPGFPYGMSVTDSARLAAELTTLSKQILCDYTDHCGRFPSPADARRLNRLRKSVRDMDRHARALQTAARKQSTQHSRS